MFQKESANIELPFRRRFVQRSKLPQIADIYVGPVLKELIHQIPVSSLSISHQGSSVRTKSLGAAQQFRNHLVIITPILKTQFNVVQ